MPTLTPDEVADLLLRLDAPEGRPASVLADLGGAFVFCPFHGPEGEAGRHLGALRAALVGKLSAGPPSPAPGEAAGEGGVGAG